MSEAANDLQVRDNPGEKRFEVMVDGQLATCYYQPSGRAIALTHTEVPPALEGRGVGSALARAALEAARSRGLKVVPQCSFVRGYIDRHAEFGDLVE